MLDANARLALWTLAENGQGHLDVKKTLGSRNPQGFSKLY